MKLSDNFAVVSSTAGSVMNHVLERDMGFRKRLKLVVTDRPCGAEDVAKRFGVPLVRLDGMSATVFSDSLRKMLTDRNIDGVFLFFTRILVGYVLEQFRGRLINFHPSLLPAFPGLSGFEDGWNSSCLLLGSTVHFIDSGIDSGPVIQQTFIPVNRSANVKLETRHKIFLQQCASLSQVADWFAENRILLDEFSRVLVRNASYDGSEGVVPALEKKLAVDMLSATGEL